MITQIYLIAVQMVHNDVFEPRFKAVLNKALKKLIFLK